MASPFGSPFAFGAKPPAFGTPQQPSQGGGLFGSPAPASTPAFGGFGAAPASTPAFGFTPNSSPAFGASSGGGLFGASAPASTGGSLFGTPAQASAPAFGSGFGAPAAASSGGFSFAAASSPSLFGGAASTPGQASGGGLFGAPSPFGASAPAASSFGSFGGGLFGAQKPATQMAPATFSMPGGLQMPGAPQPATDTAVKEIGEIRAAYTPGSGTYKFTHLFLNVVDNPAQRVKPPGVDEMRWRQALAAAGGPENPDRLWPVAASGFKDLLARGAAQSGALEENAARLKALQDLAHRLGKKHAVELKARATEVQKRHVELAHRLLHATRLLDALESRLAASIGYRGDVARAREEALSRQLAAVEAELAPSSTTSLQRRLEGVGAAARMRVGAPAGPALAQAKLDERSSTQLLAVLKDHAAGVAKLQALLKRDALDLEIMRREGGDGRGVRGMLE